jgi:hypothetical protein
MRRYNAALAAGVMLISAATGASSESAFPYEHELMLDARPMKGSKRLPSLEVAPDGTATLELWCDSVQGQFVVVGDTVTVLTGAKSD